MSEILTDLPADEFVRATPEAMMRLEQLMTRLWERVKYRQDDPHQFKGFITTFDNAEQRATIRKPELRTGTRLFRPKTDVVYTALSIHQKDDVWRLNHEQVTRATGIDEREHAEAVRVTRSYPLELDRDGELTNELGEFDEDYQFVLGHTHHDPDVSGLPPLSAKAVTDNTEIVSGLLGM